MGYEVDFLPVGDGSRAGDAIALRFGNLHGPRGEQWVVIIDGGYKDDGEALVDLLYTAYGTTHADVVISTHPDQDHISGLSVVLDQLSVGTLLMHVPELHDTSLRHASFEQKAAAVGETFAKSLTQSEGLYDLAQRKSIDVVQPFAGLNFGDPGLGVFTILGPTETYYQSLLEEMQGRDALAGSLSEKAALIHKQRGVVSTAPESLHNEILSNTSVTTASNNSSVIAMLEVDGRRLLFTGDAGEEALRPVVDGLLMDGISPGSMKFVQVPHHGSRKNVTPHLLDDLLGTITTEKRGIAFASTPLTNPDHRFPAKQTTNALRRRGYPVLTTGGAAARHAHDAPARAGYGAAEPLPLFDRVEVFEDN